MGQDAEQLQEIENTTDNDKQIDCQLGVQLKHAREAKGLSVEEAATRLNFTPQRVRDLENNDFSNMKVKAYARGYVCAYAKLFSIPIDEVMEQFNKINFDNNAEVRAPYMIITPDGGVSERTVKWGVAAVVILFIGLFGVWRFNGHVSSAPAEHTSSATAVKQELHLAPVSHNEEAAVPTAVSHNDEVTESTVTHKF